MALPEEVQELNEQLDTDDVGQKRYLMNTMFHKVLKSQHGDLGHEERIKRLRDSDGYLYKLSQDFLTSSSTFEKQQTLEKILKHID